MNKILFVCIHNSARSQMAEAFLKHFGYGKFDADSAGYEKGKLNPQVVRAMQEVGINISQNETKEVFDLFREGHHYQAVISVCDESSAERCPIFPGMVKRLTWSFPDQSQFTGTEEAILQQVRSVRDAIKDEVIAFIGEASHVKYWMLEQEHLTSK